MAEPATLHEGASTGATCLDDDDRIHRFWEWLQATTLRFLESDFMQAVTERLATLLEWLGVPPPYPEPDQIALCVTAVASTLLLYFLLFGKRHRRRRKMLAKDLREARRRVQELEEKLLEMEVREEGESPRHNKRPVRIWMDGCFDMMHYGHMNAFRQGKALGTYLVVGVNSDETITACKGPPVMNDEERLAAVEGCRFVDEVVPGVPYVMNEAYLREVMERYQIDYVVHGDDPCIVDGKDVYELPQKMGKYMTIPRTEGVSTTDIVGRMLLMSTRHHQRSESLGGAGGIEGSQTGQLASDRQQQQRKEKEKEREAEERRTIFYRRSQFLTTSRMIRLFSAGMRSGPPNRDTKVVYMDGSWDMFHAGHTKTLKKIKTQLAGGPYFLIVGVHNDQIVNRYRGGHFPIMNLHERVLSVLGCKYVDDVLIDAPYKITKEMIASLNIALVLHGTHKDRDWPRGRGYSITSPSTANGGEEGGEEDPFKVPKEMGIFQEISSDCDLSVREIIARIQRNQDQFLSKFTKKKAVEDQYYDQRYASALPPSTSTSTSTSNAKPNGHGPAGGDGDANGVAVAEAASPAPPAAASNGGAARA